MKNSRWMIAVLGIALVVQTPLVVLAETKYTSYGEYISGTEKEQKQESDYTVIEIASEEELLALAEQCRLDTWSCDKMVKLNADITLQEQTDICIPSFGGIFEGNGYTISNLEITRQGSAVGLFRYVQEGGIVRNLHVQGRVVPDGSQSQVGGIVGINYGKLYNCTFSGHIAGDSEVGGIAGVNESTGEIRRCSSDAAVSGNHSTGGITGSNHGTLNNCSNAGDINTYSTEVSYDLEDFTIENIENLNSTDNVAAHTDSGGIAGISDGKIYYCTNSGTVGYSHVGYNVGGIVGRLHQGYLQNCTNTGHILGRKDVGGIAGQMEPFLEIQYLSDKLQELDRETDKLIELLDAAHQDISSYGKQASTLAKALSGNLKNVSSAAGNLTGTANELWYIYNNELTGLNQNLKTLNNDWADIRDAEKGNEEVTEDVPVDVPDVTVSGGDSLQNIVDDTTVENIKNNIDNNVKDEIQNDIKDSIPSDQDIESYLAALEKFGDDATVHIDNMAKASGDRSGGITDNLNTLNNE
ncbi:MAG: GLUG motif-containing protein, partial [Lachnospiraceae bacterium]